MLEKLRDIKGIAPITDFSFIYLMAVCLVVLLIISVAIYLYLQPRKRKEPTQKELAFIKLKNINFENQKEVAYIFCLNAIHFLNEKNENRYKELAKKLEPFKYKKEIPLLEEELKIGIKDFIRGLK